MTMSFGGLQGFMMAHKLDPSNANDVREALKLVAQSSETAQKTTSKEERQR
jgi:hypothetical protein